MRVGGFVLVAGPSGSGKDTLIGLARAALAGERRLAFARRLVTRPASAAEDHDTIGRADFDAEIASGAFALHWRAHGLGYAIPAAYAKAAGRGAIVVCNVSRTVVEAARRSLPNVTAVEITAAPALLAQRLAARGRAEDGPLQPRLTRASVPFTANVRIVNNGTAEDGAAALIAHLQDRLCAP